LPGVNGKLGRPFVGVWSAYLNRWSPNKDLANYFLKHYLLSDEGIKAMNQAKPSGVPALISQYEIDPLALHPDVGFVYSPTVVGRYEPRAQTALNFWGIPLDPTPHLDVIGLHASLGKQLLHVAVRQGKTQILTNRQKDDFRFELPPLEQTGNR
jgi:hypothetical protein